MLRLFPNPTSEPDELAIGKARFKVAALQATPPSPAELVRHHPWSTVIGTAALAVATGALLGGTRIKVAAAQKFGGDPGKQAAKPPKAGIAGPLIGMASNLLQVYMTKQMAAARHAPHNGHAAPKTTPPTDRSQGT